MKNRFLEIHLNSSRGRIARSFKISKITIITFITILSALLLFMLTSTTIFFLGLLDNDCEGMVSGKECQEYFQSKLSQDSSLVSSSSIEFISPISEDHFYISKEFNDINHKGVDIVSEIHAEVKASAMGTVIHSGYSNIYGKIIVLAHKDNFYTFYGHLDTSFVKRHDFILKNQLIGLVGETGKTSGPHLHFEIWNEWELKNPLDLIEELKSKNLTESK